MDENRLIQKVLPHVKLGGRDDAHHSKKAS